MELTQLEQMVRWLDEERKKDKVTWLPFRNGWSSKSCSQNPRPEKWIACGRTLSLCA
jgi:hypothetical protein